MKILKDKGDSTFIFFLYKIFFYGIYFALIACYWRLVVIKYIIEMLGAYAQAVNVV